MRFFFLSLAFLTSLLLVACGGGGGAGAGAASDARLLSLGLSVGALDPQFDPATTRYVVFVAGGTTSIVLSPVANAAGATIAVDGGSPGIPVPLGGVQQAIDVVVTARDGVTALTYTVEVVPVEARDLIDPTPGVNDRFGHSVAVLGSGTIVVTDPFDSSVDIQTGAVHLYHAAISAAPFASVYGDSVAALMGFGGITVLESGHFVVHSPGGVTSVGTVQLIDGATGTQIGPTLSGALPDDFDGMSVTALANGNYAVTTEREDVAGLVDAGAVRLLSGTSGVQIGVTFAGDVPGDRMGGDGVVALTNSNFVVLTPRDDENGVVDAGSARLMSGSTGAPIGPGVVGEVTGDIDSSWVTPLANGRYVLATDSDDEGGIVDAGAVRVLDSTTGAQVGAALVGDDAGDRFGLRGATALENGNYVILAPLDDVGGVVDAGSVRLMSGATGAQIGPTMVGDVAEDRVGSSVVALGNGNYAVASPDDDENGIVDAGSARLVSGTTGAPIGAPLTGTELGDSLGLDRILALGNGNFVIVSPRDDVLGVVDAGSVRLVDGATGLQIGPPLAGDSAKDLITGGVTVLANGNYVVALPDDDEGGITRAGSVRLVSGTLGGQLGPTHAGNFALDRVGFSPTVALGDGNFVTRSPKDTEGLTLRAGSVRLVSGVTGEPFFPVLAGVTTDDQERTVVAAPPGGGFFVVGFALWDNGSVDSGRVRVVTE